MLISERLFSPTGHSRQANRCNTFTHLCAMLPAQLFVRIHKSYVVALSKIKSIERNRVYIADKILLIGDTFKDEFYKRVHGNC